MPFKFNPMTGTLDLVNSSSGSGGVSSLNGEAGAVVIQAGPGVAVDASAGAITVSARSYMPGGW